MTAHNHAQKGEIAKVVLMPGDPLRAKWIAEEMLTEARLVNNVRGMLCYTGKYKNVEISVMAHGMGIPSIGIYSFELFNMYDVDTIIRIGSAGSYSNDININDVVIVDEAFSESTYADVLGVPTQKNVLKGHKPTQDLIVDVAKTLEIPLKSVRCHSSDVFYGSRSLEETVNITQAQVVEMESFGLFANAIYLNNRYDWNKKAATLLTCSDSLITGEELDAEQRQKTFKNMVLIALESAIKINNN